MWCVNSVYLKYMQFLLYLIYIGCFWVVFPLKQPISAFIRGTGRISQLVFLPPGIIAVKKQQNQESLFYTKVPSPTGTRLPHKGWADPFSTVFSPLHPPAYFHGIWLNWAFLCLSYQANVGHNTGKVLREGKQHDSGCWQTHKRFLGKPGQKSALVCSMSCSWYTQ